MPLTGHCKKPASFPYDQLITRQVLQPNEEIVVSFALWLKKSFSSDT
jgi:hypothetical protein